MDGSYHKSAYKVNLVQVDVLRDSENVTLARGTWTDAAHCSKTEQWVAGGPDLASPAQAHCSKTAQWCRRAGFGFTGAGSLLEN